jgi:hypothetical protein
VAAQKPVTKREMQFAYYFLKKLGGNMSNPYLITAVVAWLRAEVGYDLGSMHNRNNPLNIRSSQYAVGYRKTEHNGSFAIFSSLKYGAYAAADLLSGAGHDWRHYDRIVAAARRGAKDDADQQTQARDLIEGIALSAWDAGRYGLNKAHRTLETYAESEVSIFGIWLGITGKLPSITVDVDQPRKKKAKAVPPPPLEPPTLDGPEYLRPYEAAGFYNASRPKSDLGNLPPA